MPKTIKEALAAKQARAKELSENLHGAKRAPTAEETMEINTLVKEITELFEKQADADSGTDALAKLNEVTRAKNENGGAKSLGAFFVQHNEENLKTAGANQRTTFSAPEFAKAATDTVVRPGMLGATEHLLAPDVDRNFLTALRQRLVVADWLGSGTISGNTLLYFVEGILEGDFATVAELGKKPQMSFGPYEERTETLRKIAGLIKLSSEMLWDLPFLVSEINNRLLYQLAVFEERQLLNGDGAGTNVLGLLNRSGLQTETSTGATDDFDALFRASTKVDLATGLSADGTLINPLDYQRLRLTKDGNDQYLAGGPFVGQYGQGGILENPPIWGRRTIVTPAVPVGLAIVGAGQQGATVYRKGGVTVESTNSNQDDFEFNRHTIRAEERIALAVRRPQAFVKVQLSNFTP